MDDIETKQAFLKTEILDKGYDGDEFQEFMMEQREEDDVKLEEWDMAELQAVVIKFQVQCASSDGSKKEHVKRNKKSIWDKKGFDDEEEVKKDIPKGALLDTGATMMTTNYYKKSKTTKANENKKEEDNKKEDKKEEAKPKKEEKKEEEKKDNNDDLDDEEEDPESPYSKFGDIVVCEKIQPNMFTDMNNLFFTVSEPEWKKNGIFSSGYYQYTLKNTVTDCSVVRKLSDFEWLRNKFVELFPGNFVPPLAPSHYTLKDDSPKKMLYLARFVNALSQIKVLRSTEIFESFVNLPQLDFDGRKKEFYDKKTSPKSLSLFNTLDGVINLNISKKADAKATGIQNDLYKKIAGLKKLDSAFDNVIYLFDQVSQKMKDLSKAFDELKVLYENDGVIDKCFERFGEFMSDWSKGYDNQKTFFKDELKYYFKYMQKEYDCMIPLCTNFKQSRDSYDYQFRRVKKLQAQVPKEEKALENLKKHYSYLLVSILEETKCLNQRHQERIAHQLILMNEHRQTFMDDYEHFLKLVKGEI